MPLDSDSAAEIRQIVRDELAGRRSKKPKNGRRLIVSVFVLPEELAAIDAAAAARALCRSDLLREALAPIIGRDMTVHRIIPENFRRARNRTKSSHHTSPATDDRAREEAKRRVVQTSIDARMAAAELASLGSVPVPALRQGMLSEAATPSGAPKLGR